MGTLRLFILSIVIILFHPILAQSQGETKLNQFLKFMQDGRYWDMSQVYNKSDSILPAVKLMNAAYSAIGYNRNDVAIKLLEKNIKANWKSYNGDTPYLSRLLVDLYIEEGRYEDAVTEYEWLKNTYAPLQQQYFLNIEYNKNVRKYIEEEFNVLEKARKRPQMRVVCKGESQPIKFTTQHIIKTQLNINKTKMYFTWDTGVTVPLVLPHRYADQLGLDYRQDSIIADNGKFAVAYVDSIIIGNYTFYHVPAYVMDGNSPIPALYKQHASNERLREALMLYETLNSPIIGLPIIKRLERVGIDWKQECIFFPKRQLPHPSIEGQLFMSHLSKPNLLTPLTLNSMPLMGFVDTGCDSYINLYQKIQQTYSDKFPIEYDKQDSNYSLTFEGVQDTVRIYLVSPSLHYSNQAFKAKDKIMISGKMQGNKTWDLQLGYPFFKTLGEMMVLDFKEMKVKIWEKCIKSQLY